MGIIMKDGHQYGVGGLERAEDISYDNTSSGMSATDVQGAVDELNAGLSQASADIAAKANSKFLGVINAGTSRTIEITAKPIIMLFQYGTAGAILTAYNQGATVFGDYKADITASVANNTLTVSNVSSNRNYRVTVIS